MTIMLDRSRKVKRPLQRPVFLRTLRLSSAQRTLENTGKTELDSICHIRYSRECDCAKRRWMVRLGNLPSRQRWDLDQDFHEGIV
jgi:hypothetical protein